MTQEHPRYVTPGGELCSDSRGARWQRRYAVNVVRQLSCANACVGIAACYRKDWFFLESRREVEHRKELFKENPRTCSQHTVSVSANIPSKSYPWLEIQQRRLWQRRRIRTANRF